jgi:hypothetical protein
MKTKTTKRPPIKRRPKTKLDTADTLPAAAARLGVDASLLRSLRSSGSLAFKNGRVDLAMIRAELAELPAPKAGSGDAAADLEDKQTLERRKLKAQYQREEFRLAVARREYLPAGEVAADMVRIANATRAECLRLLADAPTWEGLTASQISQKATEWMASVCVNLSDSTSRLYRWFVPGEVVRPFYDEKAKARQGARNDLVNIVEKIPQGNRDPQSRDEAGKVAE